MASNSLNEPLRQAVTAYVEGDATLDDLWQAALLHLEIDQADQFLRSIPADAAAQIVRLLAAARLSKPPLISIGKFEPTRPSHDMRDAMVTHVGAAVDWFATLDIPSAVANVRSDSFGDWYRDPWGWPELTYLAAEGRIHILTRAITGPAHAAVAIDVPKSSTKTRPAVVFDLVDRVLYQACVDSFASRVDSQLKNWVFGWRVGKNGKYAGNRGQWRGYFRRLRKSAQEFGCAWRTDISNFFASIRLDDLDRALEPITPARTARTVASQIHGAHTRGRSGVPQRSRASSVIANLLLSVIDDVADQVSAAPVRWLDDVWLFATSENQLVRSSDQILAKLGDLGLTANTAKTAFYEGRALTQAIDRLDLSYIDSQLENEPESPALNSALELLLANPEAAARHEIAFVTSRIKRYHRVDLARQLAEHRINLAYAADLVAPVLLKLGVWRDLTGWCGELLASDQLPWMKTAFLRMYPRSEAWPRDLVDRFIEASMSPDHDPLVRVTAISRIPKIAPKTARDLFDAQARSSVAPVIRRALGAIAVHTGIESKRIKRFLLEDDRTVPFAEFVSSAQYQRDALRVRV